MKDLISLVVEYLPRYFIELGSIFSGPKRFLRGKDLLTEQTFSQALLFLGVGIILYLLLTTPLRHPQSNVWAWVTAEGLYSFIVLVLSTGWLWIAWRATGVQPQFRSMFVIYTYLYGVMVLLAGIAQLLPLGFLRVFDPELYRKGQAMIAGQQLSGLRESWTLYTAFAIQACGWLFVFAWGFIAWGAFRALYQSSKQRSAIALVIFLVMAFPINQIATYTASVFLDHG